MNLGELAVGEQGQVIGFAEGGRSYRKKLLAMGLIPGTPFSVTWVTPLGDPVEIQIRGFKLSLRKDEAAVGIFTGILAKEAVVGTLDSLYTALAEAAETGGAVVEEAGFSLWGGLSRAFATIPANLGDALGTWVDPLGIGIGDVSSQEAAAAEQAVATGTFGAMAARFDGAAGAFAYLLFILLYFPCTAALAAVYRETNISWTLFVAAWTTGMAYVIGTVFYQAAIFTRQPVISAAWIGGMLAIFLLVVVTLRWWGMREKQRSYTAAADTP